MSPGTVIDVIIGVLTANAIAAAFVVLAAAAVLCLALRPRGVRITRPGLEPAWKRGELEVVVLARSRPCLGCARRLDKGRVALRVMVPGAVVCRPCCIDALAELFELGEPAA